MDIKGEDRMVKLTLTKAENIVKKILGKSKGYTRYISVDFYSKKHGWNYKTDKSRITVITSQIHNTPPYQRNKSRKTVSVNDPNNIKKLKKWAEDQW